MPGVDISKLVIRPERSNKLIIALIVGSFFLILLAYYLGYSSGDDSEKNSSEALLDLRSGIAKLQNENSALLFEIAKLDQYKEVQLSAYKELEKNYEVLDQKNEFLNRRVNFYRSILSPRDGISGLRIHDVRLVKVPGYGIDFEVVLIQSISHKKKIKVKLLIELYDNKGATYPIAESKNSGDEFSFDYSEIVKGGVSFNFDDKPKFIKVTAIPNKDKSKKLVEWHKI